MTTNTEDIIIKKAREVGHIWLLARTTNTEEVLTIIRDRMAILDSDLAWQEEFLSEVLLFYHGDDDTVTDTVLDLLEKNPETDWDDVFRFVFTKNESTDEKQSYRLRPNLRALKYIIENHTDKITITSLTFLLEKAMEHFFNDCKYEFRPSKKLGEKRGVISAFRVLPDYNTEPL